MQVSLIIAAGGSGERFRKGFESTQIPSKLLMPLHGKPVLARTLQAFQSASMIFETIIACSQPDEVGIKALVKEYQLKRIRLVRGGATRSESVRNALSRVHTDTDWVMVHDGARPFVKPEVLDQLVLAARDFDGVVLAKKVIPTIKEASSNLTVYQTLDRSRLYEAETPQLIRRTILSQAYESPEALQVTDEASLLEAYGIRVKLVLHDGWNPKITTRQDFELAENYLKGLESKMTKHGLGYDFHRLVPKRKLYLGGVHVPFEKGSLGHSDGDVLLHAVIDGILGALGLGDIGEWFSDKNPKYKGIRSAKMLETVLAQAYSAGWKVEQIDSVIHLEKPKLMPYKELIRKNVAKLLGVSPENVSVKAKTGEGLGSIGSGEAISAEALVILGRKPS